MERLAAMTGEDTTDNPIDVLIVGAGLSGIGAAAHLRTRFPRKKIVLLESRSTLGGTWDLFRYPGVRSDSDMYTLGYRALPWRRPRSIVDGASILQYLREVAERSGVAQSIRYGCKVVSLSWSSARCEWRVTVRHTDTDRAETLRARFVQLCTGYYDYDQGYRPSFDGEADFRGKVVHPQFWPRDLDYSGQRIVVIGSGATAVTLVPALCERAASVTMLQRSPSYVANQPGVDPLAALLSKFLPAKLVYPLVRWKCILMSALFYRIARWRPMEFRKRLLQLAAAELPPGYDVEKHFGPQYAPWDQRLCAVPDGDLFREIRHGRAHVVTDVIDRFVPEGIRLRSGDILPADLIVTATGLRVQPLGAVHIDVDGRAVKLAETMVYRGAMLSGVPNMIHTFGYTNASWTLRADLINAYLGRLLNYMDRHRYDSVVAERDASVGEMPFIDFNSGYVLRALSDLPKQGDRFPWRIHQNYLRDLGVTRFSRLTDPALQFARRAS